jgi:hypothetical protein
MELNASGGDSIIRVFAVVVGEDSEVEAVDAKNEEDDEQHVDDTLFFESLLPRTVLFVT